MVQLQESMQNILRYMPPISVAAASKSVTANISGSGCLLAEMGGSRLRSQAAAVSHISIGGSQTWSRCVTRDGVALRGLESGGRSLGIQPGRSAFKRRLGEFYSRFYSAVCGARRFAHWQPKNSERTGSDVRSQHRTTTRSRRSRANLFQDRSLATSTLQKDEKEEGGPLPVDGEAAQSSKAGVDGFPHQQPPNRPVDPSPNWNSSLIDLHDPTRATRYTELSRRTSQPRPPKNPPTRPPRAFNPISPHKAEEATINITRNLLDHERLGRDLRRLINQKLRELDLKDKQTQSWGTQPASSREVEMLRNALRWINSKSVSESTKATEKIIGQEPRPLLMPRNVNGRLYIPPFPRYEGSKTPAIKMNKALHALLSRRPVPHSVIPKVCYNLLTSPIPPDTHTYNILINQLVYLRQNTLAELVFQEMIRAGDMPDEYTVVALLNLMSKMGDLEGWSKVVKIQKREEKSWRELKGRKRSKYLLETLIIHSARFGQRSLIKRYTRALRRYWPEDPEPSKNVLTALIRFYGEKQEWNNGYGCWAKLLKMDSEATEKALREGKEEDAQILDQFAWYWWLKHCKSCSRGSALEKWADRAMERGIDVERLLARGPDKQRGLYVRSTNKNPALTQRLALGDWWEEKRIEKQAEAEARGRPASQPGFTEDEKRSLLGDYFYHRIYGIEESSKGFIQPVGPQTSFIPMRNTGSRNSLSAYNPPWTVPGVSAEQSQHGRGMRPENAPGIARTRNLKWVAEEQNLWQDILIRRMRMLLHRHYGQEVKEKEGEIRITPEERKRAEILIQWERKYEGKVTLRAQREGKGEGGSGQDLSDVLGRP